jgi:hypothetical protein
VYICCSTPGMSQSGTFAPFWLAWRSGVELRRDSYVVRVRVIMRCRATAVTSALNSLTLANSITV